MSIYQVVVKAVGASSVQLRNIHHYEFPGYVPTEVELQEFADNFGGLIEETVKPGTSTSVTFNGLDIRRVDVGDLPAGEFLPDGWPIAGSATGNPLPSQIAALVVWKSNTDYPRSTRSYMFPNSVGAVTSTGLILGALRTELNAFALEAEEIEVTGQVDAQKVAVQYGGSPRAVVASNLVSATPVGDIFATQRSRRVGVGI